MLSCMTSVNIWQENVVYDKLTINRCQKLDQAFSGMLNGVWQGSPSSNTIQALKERVISKSTIDTFAELLSADQGLLCHTGGLPKVQHGHAVQVERRNEKDSVH